MLLMESLTLTGKLVEMFVRIATIGFSVSRRFQTLFDGWEIIKIFL
jgi:hypothetical protein